MMDDETAIIIESYRRRRALGDEIVGLLADLQAEQRWSLVHVRAKGKREVGVALFQATAIKRVQR